MRKWYDFIQTFQQEEDRNKVWIFWAEQIFYLQCIDFFQIITDGIKPRILCNENGVLPHLQMGVTVMGFVEDLC